MPKTLTEDHKRAMARGREKARRASDRAAIARVVKFKAWTAAGSKVGAIPEVPSSADFKKARAAGKVA